MDSGAMTAMDSEVHLDAVLAVTGGLRDAVVAMDSDMVATMDSDALAAWMIKALDHAFACSLSDSSSYCISQSTNS